MKRKGGTKTLVIALIMVGLIVGYYFYLVSRSGDSGLPKDEDQVVQEMSPVQELLVRASYREYPSTPVQVLKYYNEVTSCFYNEDYTDNELEQLAMIARSLYDMELVVNQTQDAYMSKLRDDIAVFKAGNITIYNTEVTPATDVEYFTYDGYECARLYCFYTLKSGTYYQGQKEVFIMRKDNEGHWKIFGFDLVEKEE